MSAIPDHIEAPKKKLRSSILSFKDLGGLARRMVKYHLHGMTFRKYLNLAYDIKISPLKLAELTSTDRSRLGEIKDEIALKVPKPLPLLFDEYLKRGYYAFSLTTTLDSPGPPTVGVWILLT